MNPGVWIAIYLPLFVLLFVILPRRRRIMKLIMANRIKRKGLKDMTAEVIGRYVGKYCKITTGALGTTVKGTIAGVQAQWIEIETSKGKELVNSDFVQSIRIL